MTSKGKIQMSDYSIFWDNGKYVAVFMKPNGERVNIAPYNCQTKKEAMETAREHRDLFNEGRGV